MDSKYKSIIDEERNKVKAMFSKRDYICAHIVNDPQILIMKYVVRLRKSEYFYRKYKSCNKKILKILYALLWLLHKRNKNVLGNKIGIDIREGSVDRGIHIYHPNIVVNGHAVIGKNCKLHGSNCIGNNGKDGKCPIIGDNVDIGYGAIIIGDVVIANDVKIAAGAVVVKSIEEEGATVAGIPARIIT